MVTAPILTQTLVGRTLTPRRRSHGDPHRARETIRFARKSRELLTFLDEEKRLVS
jgi:hypothetical protein